MDDVILSLKGISFEYSPGERVVNDVSLECTAGSWTAVMGPSGSGKSTMLYCAAGLLRPQSGSVSVLGEALERMKEKELTRFRRDHLGFIFQDYNLVGALTCLQNTLLPGIFGASHGHGRGGDNAYQALAKVGLEDLAHRYPTELSGGQQQRVAIARAFASGAELIYADEPTGALDVKTSERVLQLLSTSVAQGHSILMVTHDPRVAAYADRTVFLVDGKIRSVLGKSSASAISAELEVREESRPDAHSLS